MSTSQITAVVPPGAFTGPIFFSTGSPFSSPPLTTYQSTGSFRVTLGIALSSSTGTPGSTTTVSGAGFGADEAVDIYAGETAEQLVTTDDNGTFSTSITIPTTAQPGPLEITAVGRRTEDSAGAAFTVNTDWDQDGFGTGGTNDNPFEDTINASNVGNLGPDLSLSFNAQTYTSGNSLLPPAPIEAGGNYLISELSPSHLDDVSPAGQTRWTFSADSTVLDTTVAAGSVYLVTDDEIYAVSEVTGSLLWSQPIPLGGASGASEVRVIVDGSQTVVSAAVGNGSESGGYLTLTAFAATSGSQDWTDQLSPIEGTFTEPLNPEIAAGDGLIFAVDSGTDSVSGFNPATGTEVASYSASSVVENFAYRDGKLYVAIGGRSVVAIQVSSRSTIWTQSVASLGGGLAVTGNSVYVAPFAPSQSGPYVVTALDATTGVVEWTLDTASAGGGSMVSPVVANGVLYLSEQGLVQAVDSSTGASLWSVGVPTGASVEPTLSVANGVLAAYDIYAGTFNTFDLPSGRVSALDRRTARLAAARGRSASGRLVGKAAVTAIP